MNRTRLSTTDLQLSPIGLGCAAMGRDARAWGPVDDNESIATIHAALDTGINWLDTAPSYGAGHSEIVVGNALQDRRDAALIVTQCGRPLSAAGDRSLKRDSILRECEASLRRLRSDYIDIYLCELPDPATPLEETLDALSTLLSQGKVRAIGAAEFGCEPLTAWRSSAPLHVIMPRLNLFEQDSARDLLPYGQRHQIGVIACSPLCRGLLSGRFSSPTRLLDLRLTDSDFTI